MPSLKKYTYYPCNCNCAQMSLVHVTWGGVWFSVPFFLVFCFDFPVYVDSSEYTPTTHNCKMSLRYKLSPYNISLLLYPTVYLGSIPLTLLLKQYNQYIGQIFFVRFLEQYLVSNNGYLWFTTLYWLLVVFTAYLPNRNRDFLIFYTKIYLINTIWIVVLLEWFFGSPIFERISVIAGATCSIRGIYREYACKQSGGVWTDPFDSSSHYTYLISSSLLIWHLFLNHVTWISGYFPKHVIDLENSTHYAAPNSITVNDVKMDLNRIFRTIIEVIAVFILIMWFILYTITSVFFHTIPEKFVGLLCGLFVPIVLKYIK